MKRILFTGCLAIYSLAAFTQQPLKDSFYTLTPVEIKGIRANENAPFTKTNITGAELKKNNLGQDIPFLLNHVPSVVINSDAGNGIGYTGIRIRGTDASRTNVTLNGIPYNDAESQGTFFVDLPDFASSAGSIQIQRGVGTSSNGAGAFGSSINISTNEVNKDAYAEFNNAYGSFNSIKNTIKAGTGLQNRLLGEVRLSRISSDGFIDRASSNLRSIYFTTAYIAPKASLRLNVFSGKEKTYQAWNGISETDLKAGNRSVNYSGTEKPGEPYDNEVDNYLQTHYQFFYNQQAGKYISLSTALYLTRGEGYYEQYKADGSYAAYNMPDAAGPNGPITETDLVRQLWLDNDYFGSVFSINYKKNKTQATFGGAITRYNGNHFGKVIWAAQGLTTTNKWYDLDARKDDLNVYLKQQTTVAANWHLFYDLQYRQVDYAIGGFRNNPSLKVNSLYHFFNPKAGISFTKNGWKGFLSYAVANKEPVRDDFEAGNNQQPKPERLNDMELGIERRLAKYSWAATFYYMNYKDQLVLTGQINDVGAYTRTNIPNSYRAGIELQGEYRASAKFSLTGNITLSQNKVKNFTEYIDDYDNGGQKANLFAEADIAYSPAVTGAATLTYKPVSKLELSLFNKYVSSQYLDNTSNKSRMLDAFFVQDFKASYTVKYKWLKEVNFIAQVNNLLNTKYEPNGYTFSYIYGGGTTTENFYFPMAGVNFMVGVNIRM
jgi:iron complex outermembrane recepter protein